MIATIAYRGGKTVRGAPDSFGGFEAAPGVRTPVQILAHIGDLLDWTLSISSGKQQWRSSTPLPWPQETARFFAALAALEAYLASEEPVQASIDKLFQAPIADALTHVGQIAILRRLAGAPVSGENYYVAKIAAGSVGPEQAAPVLEF
jgi:hypothetical protein